LFKKRQLSNLQLVIAGAQTEALRERLETYKYRGDIHWADAGVAGADPYDVMGAAYAVLFPFEDGSLGTSLLNAWKGGVPALVARSSRLREMADDAAMIAGVDDPAALAGYMMSVYKDETQRNALIEKGTARLAELDPSPSLAAICTAIGREINKIN
jgi:glycosyltransferase involved in cell wall biosynthesis